MKRQSTGIRTTSEESEQSYMHENKRLKVLHNPQESSSIESETGSSSSLNAEDSTYINGHDISISMTQEEILYQDCPENNMLSDPYINGTYQPGDENFSENGNSLTSHMNGSFTDHNENLEQNVHIVNHTHVSENVAENNLLGKFTFCNPIDNSFVNVDANCSPQLVFSENNSLSASPSKLCNIIHTDFPSTSVTQNESYTPPTAPPQSDEDLQYNYETCISPKDINKEEKLQNLPTICDINQKSTEEDIVDVANESSALQEKEDVSLSSQEENSCQSDAKLASSSTVDNDIENVTLCQLKVTQLEGHADVVFSVAADEDFILSSSGDTTVKVWDVEERREMCNFAGHHAAVTSVILLDTEQSEKLRSKLNCFQTSRIALSASYDCHIRLWSVLDGHEILSMYTFNSITCMGYLDKLMYVVVGTEGGKLELWDLQLAKLVHAVYAHDSAVSDLEVHDCYVYSTSKDGMVKVWLFEEDELQPLYTRRRKETTSNPSGFDPTQWKAITAHNDILFLGDNTPCVKALDWRIGRLRLFKNQPDNTGVCEAVLAKNNVLLTTFFDCNSDTGGINVWRLPDVAYVGTLTGDLQEICSLAMTQSKDKLRIVSGGHQLLVWDFDFSKPPIRNSEDLYFVCEADKVGVEVNEQSIERIIFKGSQSDVVEDTEEKKSWCNIS